MEHIRNFLFLTLSVFMDNVVAAGSVPVEDVVALITQIILLLYTIIKLVQEKKFIEAILKIKDVITLLFKVISILKKKSKNKNNTENEIENG